jgi:aminoglycoside 6'-N-acetyltransferase
MTTSPDEGASIDFQPLTRPDFPLLATWFAAPHVAPWWQEPYGPDDLETRYGPAVDGTDPTEACIVTLGGRPLGLVIRYRIEDEPAWHATLAPTGAPLDGFGIDYLIGDPGRTGRGLGPRMIAAIVADSWVRYPRCPGCVVAVHEGNRRSWRALESAGFTRVWSGQLVSEDPSDAGPQVVYALGRPPP